MKYSLNGQEYDLVYNLHTMEKMEEEFGDAAEAMHEFRSKKKTGMIRAMFRLMANTGRWLRGEPEDLTGHEIDRLGLKGLDTLSRMISAAMDESLRSETTGGNEADDQPYDLVMAAIEEKEKNG